MKPTVQAQLLQNPAYLAAKSALLKAVSEHSARVNGSKATPGGDADRSEYLAAIQAFGKDKGRDQYYPFLSSGLGSGPYVELRDGSVKLDLITGIGVNFFGHSHPELMAEVIDAAASDVMQGNLQPGYEAQQLIRTLLEQVGPKSRLRHGWLMCSGTMANEVALKIIRQKKFPATKVLAFTDCFAGRSTAMQEITDNPKYREGQPIYGEVHYLPFYRKDWSLERNIEETLGKLQFELARHPGKFAAMMIELIQGEGGFNFAPREWYAKLFEAVKSAGIAVWIDEIQTFGRTERMFATQMFELEEYADVITVGKLLQACGALFTEEMNPKPGLVAGTFAGSAAALKTGRRSLEMLSQGGYYGPQGKNATLGKAFAAKLARLAETSLRGKITDIRQIGGMIAFQALGGSMDETKRILMKLFDAGVIAFYAGHGPYLIRMLPPFGVIEEKHLDEACAVIESVLKAETT